MSTQIYSQFCPNNIVRGIYDGGIQLMENKIERIGFTNSREKMTCIALEFFMALIGILIYWHYLLWM